MNVATATWLGGWLDDTRRYCINTAKPILKLFRPAGSPIILVFWFLTPIPNSKGNPFSGGYEYAKGWENWRFSTEIAVYLGNGARYADVYYGTLIGSYGCQIAWYHFRWPWVTLTRVSRSLYTYKLNISITVGLQLFLNCRPPGLYRKTCKMGVVVENFAQEGWKFSSLRKIGR